MHQFIFCKCNQDLHHSSMVNSVKLKPDLCKETSKQRKGREKNVGHAKLSCNINRVDLVFFIFYSFKRFESWFITCEILVFSAKCNCHLIYSNKILIKDSCENKKNVMWYNEQQRIIHFRQRRFSSINDRHWAVGYRLLLIRFKNTS